MPDLLDEVTQWQAAHAKREGFDVGRVTQAAGDSSAAEIDDALGLLVTMVQQVEVTNVGLLSLVCGALVEDGGDPQTVGPALLDRVRDVYAPAGGRWQRMLASRDQRTRAKENASRFEAGMVAHLARSKALRAEARSQPDLLALVGKSTLAGWESSLVRMLRVLDDERLVVLHPAQHRGFEATIGGVPVNYELTVLLESGLVGDPDAGYLSGDPVDLQAAEQILAADPPDGDVLCTAQFNLWNWSALQPDQTLPDATAASSDRWIWNEECPADIVPFEGTRVVLLGPPPYTRTFTARRTFSAMVPQLDVKLLSDTETSSWLERLASAPR